MARPKKTVKKTIPKKSGNKRPPKVIENVTRTKPIIPKKDVKSKSAKERKYLKVLASESIEVFREIGERVFKKELKWAYYAIENSKGTHYYLIL